MTYQEYRLGDICRLVKGTFSSTKTLPGEYPLVVTAAQRRTADGFDLEGPAVCIPLISSTGHGDAAIHRLHYQEGPFALANLLVALIPLPDSPANAEYLYWYLTAKKDEVLVPLMRGTANVSLKEKDIAEVYVPLPPLPEQQRIVARVKGLLDKVEEATRLREEVGSEETAFVVSLHLALAADREVKVSEFLELSEEKIPVVLGQKYPQVGVRSFGKGLFEREILDASQTTYKHFHLLKEGAVVLSQVKGWEGAIGVCPPSLAGRFASPEFRTFSCLPERAESAYLATLMKTEWFWSRLKDATRGVGARRERTRPEQFLQMVLPMPTLEKQRQAIAIFEKLDRAEAIRTSSQPELQALPASILAQAFAGAL